MPMPKTRMPDTVAAAFVGLNLLDGILTLLLVRLGGIEVNPMMRFIIQIDALGFLSFKMGLTIVIGGILLRRKHHRILLASTIAFAGVCLWNLFMLLVTTLKRGG